MSDEELDSGGGGLITVTPNPAVDVTYHLPHLVTGQMNRVVSVARRPGGKGVNVASVLAQLGHRPVVSGFLGGASGEWLTSTLTGAGIAQRWAAIDGETRSTTTLVDEVSTTLLNEPGPQVGDDDWTRLETLVCGAVGAGDTVVLSGSCPPGTRPEHVRRFIEAVRSRGAAALVDTSGPLLLTAAEAGADLLKPNREELLEATGAHDVLEGARTLLDLGAGTVAVSLGSEGLIVVTREPGTFRAWQAAPVEVVNGNATGAGDAAVAALALGLRDIAGGAAPRDALPAALTEAVALSAAAVLAPVAGVVDLSAFERFRPLIRIKETHAAR